MNVVVLIGRLTRDPDVRYSGEKAIAKFSLAVDRGRRNDKGETEADFINCVAFEKTAQFFEKYTHQGSKVAINGRIQTGSYTNKDNQKVYTTDVVVNTVEFAESKQQEQQPGPRVYNLNIPDGVKDEGLPFN